MLPLLFLAITLIVTPPREPPACVERIPHDGWKVHGSGRFTGGRISYQWPAVPLGGAEMTRKSDGRHTVRECHPLGDRRA